MKEKETKKWFKKNYALMRELLEEPARLAHWVNLSKEKFLNEAASKWEEMAPSKSKHG